MGRKWKKFIIFCFCGFFFSQSLFGTGYLVPEQGASNMSTGNAGAAVGMDASANWFNPAALIHLKGTQTSIGFTYIYTDPEYKGKNSNFTSFDPDYRDAIVPHTYISHRIHKLLAVGLGITTPFGLESNWGLDWQGQRINTNTFLRTTIINPNLAFTLPESLVKRMAGIRLSFGIGLDIGFGRFILGRRIDQSGVGNPVDGNLKIIGGGKFDPIDFDKDILALGFNTGLLVEWKNFSLGVSYRNKMGYHVDHSKAADADFMNIDPLLQAAGIVDQKVNTRLFTPSIVMIGLMYRWKKFEFIFDAWWTDWSVFNTLHLDFQGSAPDSTIEEHWHSSWAFRGGVRYYLKGAPLLKYKPVSEAAQDLKCEQCGKPVSSTDTKCPNCGAEFESPISSPGAGVQRLVIPQDQIYCAFGLYYDNTPIPDSTVSPTLPDSDRYGFSFGVGFKKGNFGADLGVLFLFSDDRYKNNLHGASSPPSVNDPFTANGKYTVWGFLIGFTIHFRI